MARAAQFPPPLRSPMKMNAREEARMSERTTRPLVSADDDPLFNADHAHHPASIERRASITVAQVEQIADGSMWRCPPPCCSTEEAVTTPTSR
jgi:hypothetical protein